MTRITVDLLAVDSPSPYSGVTYPRAEVQKAVQEYLERDDRLGTLGWGDTQLPITPDTASHIVEDMWFEGNTLRAVIKVIDTEQGKLVSKLIRDGHQLRVSPSSIGVVDDNLVATDIKLLHTTFVVDPSDTQNNQ